MVLFFSFCFFGGGWWFRWGKKERWRGRGSESGWMDLGCVFDICLVFLDCGCLKNRREVYGMGWYGYGIWIMI